MGGAKLRTVVVVVPEKTQIGQIVSLAVSIYPAEAWRGMRTITGFRYQWDGGREWIRQIN